MHAAISSAPICPAIPMGSFVFEDPLEADQSDDTQIVTTRRALCRVATVAAEAGARFQREAGPIDPMDWMTSPRRPFDGACAMDACLDRDHFVKAVILHGLSLGLDADPDIVAQLHGPDDGEDFSSRLSRPKRGRSGKKKSTSKPTLYSATLAWEGNGVILQAFHASVARNPAEVVQRLRARFSDDVLDLVDVRVGFNAASPLAIALVPETVSRLLHTVERESDAPRFATFSYDIEQRLEQ